MMHLVKISLLLLALHMVQGVEEGTGADDLINNVPGLNFKPSFKQYSGYLNATDGRNIFYWLVESQSNPSEDPIVLWLQGGPGCSGLGGFLTELGPFHVNPDGHSLYENVFTWNKFTNLLFIESPTGVGFSYSSPKNDSINDDQTAYYNFHALRDFFYTKFPQYQTHDFYVTGESYGGVYIPTLAKNLIDGIAAGQFPDNFKGIAIGNGILSEAQQFNSLINLMYYHGISGPEDWNPLISLCCKNTTPDQCDFYNQRLHPSDCSGQIIKYMNKYQVNDQYNIYQDCYASSNNVPGRRSFVNLINPGVRFKAQPVTKVRGFPPGTSDMAHQLNYDSTDSDFGFQCWSNETVYFNDLEVKKALHVADDLLQQPWCSCCDIPYKRTYYDMADTFKYIIQKSKIRILIYNGDVDSVCNFLGDQWFIERQVAPENQLQVVREREAWKYRQQIAGFVKQFDRLDLLTVKGSGHFVPADRAGPALQMIANFIWDTNNYSKATGINVNPKPVNP